MIDFVIIDFSSCTDSGGCDGPHAGPPRNMSQP